MSFAAITYDIKPGFEEEIVEIFRNFRRVASADVNGGSGVPSRILSTAVFIRDDTLVRVIEYEGDLLAIARHMAEQPGVHEVEQKLAPYLTKPRDTATPEGFLATFQRSLLRTISQISVRDLPVDR
ncbi:SchA/CurD like domain-containing protein [Tamaricihabitans halophyticus]|uniref:SchA/CurD like domain-containing protein n=1 Tax=Tamaricihabitans halophyticus TaxID=1262583 RepID=A0A4R2R2N4_9PSEU|nr:SchA/CurD-like domain-containing protein [Tamaricihabitans halophyticus]TCP56803.1 SchA/CurD like domain-containing protein [Tamaricihabitans halophyticus]